MSTEFLQSTDGVQLALHDFGGDGPAVLFVHGTSFHAHVLAPLARRLLGHHCFGLDLRGHGESGRPLDNSFQWPSLGEDVAVALQRLEDLVPGPIIGVGHSAGATGLLLATSKRPERCSFLYCYEPIAFANSLRSGMQLPPALAGAARRRAHFDSVSDALAYYSERPPLSGLDEEVLREYVMHGLVADEEGVRLACEPSYEASIYVAGYESDVWGDLLGARCPVTIAYGAKSEGIGPLCAPLLAASLAHSSLECIEDLGHLGPLEDPERVAASIITAIDRAAT